MSAKKYNDLPRIQYHNCTSVGLGSGATAASLVVARGPAITLALEICTLTLQR